MKYDDEEYDGPVMSKTEAEREDQELIREIKFQDAHYDQVKTHNPDGSVTKWCGLRMY